MSNPDPVLERCTEELTHSRVTVKANGRTATFLNSNGAKISKVDIDCWLSRSADTKADYLLCKPGVVDVVIELKGKDIAHGIEQILSTHALWRKIPSCSAKIGGLIVFTRSPVRSAMLDNTKAKLLAKHGIWLEMGKSGLKDYEFETFTGART